VTAGSNVGYAWDFGDGALGSGVTASHTYAAAGIYTAVVTATNGVSTLTATTGVTVTELGTLGDVNGDGLADSTDALIILSADAGINTSQFCPMNCGDVNGDGYVDSTDALIVLSYDAAMSVPYPVGQPGCPFSVTQPPGCAP
jgi:PKD repeat protein